MEDELLSFVQEAIVAAKKAGADDVFARTARSREVEFTGRDGELEKVQENTSRSLTVQLYVDGRYSSHTTTSLRPARIESFLTEAVALTRALEPDPHRALPDPALYGGDAGQDLQITDPAVDALSNQQRNEWLGILNEGGHRDERVISAQGYISSTRSDGAAASSNGFVGRVESNSVWLGCSVTVRGDGDARPEGGLWIGGRRMDQLQTPESVAAEALRRATTRLGSVKGPTRKTTMVVDPTVAGSLIGRLLGPADARSISQGRSFYEGKVGQRLFPDALTIVDDPLLPGGLGSRPYDPEGITSRRLPIIENGVLQNLFVDTYYGRKTGMAPTTGGPSNLLVKPGVDKGLAELCAEVGEGVYVTSWLGGNADGTTGDFSLGLRGHLIEGGEIGQAVGEMNVTGNLVDLFAQLAMVGNDPWPYRSTQVPTLVFADVQFSGA
jgi:PmbA protein